MSLVYVFVGIARRLGIIAGPVNYPERVLAYVTAPSPRAAQLLFDVYSEQPPVVRAGLVATLGASGADFGLLSPCPPVVMLQRAANNIINFVQFQRVHRSAGLMEANLWADYAACTCFLLRTQEPHLAIHITQFKSFDSVAVLYDVLGPQLDPPVQKILEEQASEIEEQDEQRARVQYRRFEHQVAFFVGLVFKHARYGYIGCITGWEVRRSLLPLPAWLTLLRSRRARLPRSGKHRCR